MTHAINTIGAFFAHKAIRMAHSHGIAHAARMLRKQGVPVEMAAAILARI